MDGELEKERKRNRHTGYRGNTGKKVCQIKKIKYKKAHTVQTNKKFKIKETKYKPRRMEEDQIN